MSNISKTYFNIFIINLLQRNLLKLKGGVSIHDIVKNIFKTLLLDSLLIKYSWKGARDKYAFGNFKLVSLFIGIRMLIFPNILCHSMCDHT